MTTTLETPPEVEAPEVPELDVLTSDLAEHGVDEGAPDVVAPAALGLAVVSGALSAAGAAWMIGGTFRGSEAPKANSIARGKSWDCKTYPRVQ